MSLQAKRAQESIPASEYGQHIGSNNINLIEQLKGLSLGEEEHVNGGVPRNGEDGESEEGTLTPGGGSPSQGTVPSATASPTPIADQIEDDPVEGTEGHEELYTASHGALPDAEPGQTPADAGLRPVPCIYYAPIFSCLSLVSVYRAHRSP